MLAALVAAAGWWLADEWSGREPVEVAPPVPARAGAVPAAVRSDRSSVARPAPLDPKAAILTVAGRQVTVAANARGEFHRVPVPPLSAIFAAVPFPDAAPGDRIAVQTEDGGLLTGDAARGFVTLDSARRAAVEFRASGGEGVQRVTLRHGGESRLLQFWVGPLPPVAVRVKG